MKNFHISDDDLVRIFSYDQRKAQYKSAFWSAIRGVFTFLIILLLIYIATNFYALKAKFVYWYDNELIISTDNNSSEQPAAPTHTQEVIEKPILPSIAPNTISIPAISINPPVIWEVNNTADEVANGLERGVVHLHGTALPGQTGNIYITGHSSNYSWARGHYNSIFALLDKLVVGDMIYLNYQDITYSYAVASAKIVLATDSSVLEKTGDSRLSLVTCWPIGTSLKRLVVVANQVYPNPDLNTQASGSLDATKLPSGR